MRFTSKTLMILSALLVFQAASGQILKVDTTSTSATTSDGLKLHSIGSGLRSKKVLLVNVKVYTGQLFVSDLSKFKKNSSEALNSLSESGPVAFRLSFHRDVDAEKVQNSFKDALVVNKVDLKKTEIQSFLMAVKNGGEAKEGKHLTIFGSKKSDGNETLTYEDANQKSTAINGGPGLIKDVFAIWLGTPVDDGIEKLKAEILK